MKYESLRQTAGIPAVAGHVLLFCCLTFPMIVPRFTYVNIVATACIAVYVGCHRSVKEQPPEDQMTMQDAVRFPWVGSAVLLSLFLVLKYIPKNLISFVLNIYFTALGFLACTALLEPFAAALLPPSLKERCIIDLKEFKIPVIMKTGTEVKVQISDCMAGVVSLGVSAWYFLHQFWYTNNLLGISFSVTGIEFLSLSSVQVGLILLTGLFFYDIFWVFFTPVMVSVAKSFEGPIKLVFPSSSQLMILTSRPDDIQFNALGLGDIVIPGIFVALMLRYDYQHGFKSYYFVSAFCGYIGGLGTTIAVLHFFKAAQPALLYIVPAVVGSVAAHAALRGELLKVYNYGESPSNTDAASQGKKGDEAAGAEKDKGQESVEQSEEPAESKKGQ